MGRPLRVLKSTLWSEFDIINTMSYTAVIFGFFGWWYSGGLILNLRYLGALLGYLKNLFSVTEILKTFFSPWKRVIGPSRRGIAGFFDLLVDNLVSRSVGMFVRSFLLIGFLFSVVIWALFSLGLLAIWIFMPLIIFVALINLSGVFL